jgi:copper chaperone CopZ
MADIAPSGYTRIGGRGIFVLLSVAAEEGRDMTTITYRVDGMTCGHCVTAVTEEVRKVPGVTAVEVNLDVNAVTVAADGQVDDAQIAAAVDEAGYILVERV